MLLISVMSLVFIFSLTITQQHALDRIIEAKVDSVCSGELAIQFIKDNPVDLIVMDMLMGSGMTGYQTYKEIRNLSPKQKAIIASGFSKSDDVKATLTLGASGFLRKPYSIKELGRIVKEALCGESNEN